MSVLVCVCVSERAYVRSIPTSASACEYMHAICGICRERVRTCRIVWYAVISFCTRDVHAECTRSTRDQPQTAWRTARRAAMETRSRTHTHTHGQVMCRSLYLAALSDRDDMKGGKWKIVGIESVFM